MRRAVVRKPRRGRGRGRLRQAESVTSEDLLPNEMWVKVFRYIENKTILREVCKSWEKIINGCFELAIKIDDKNWSALLSSEIQPFINTARIQKLGLETSVNLDSIVFLQTLNHLKYHLIPEEKQLLPFLLECQNLGSLTIYVDKGCCTQSPEKTSNIFMLNPTLEDKQLGIYSTLKTFRYKRSSFYDYDPPLETISDFEEKLFGCLFPILAKCPITRMEFWNSWDCLSAKDFFKPTSEANFQSVREPKKFPTHLLHPVIKSIEVLRFGFTHMEDSNVCFGFKKIISDGDKAVEDCLVRQLQSVQVHLPQNERNAKSFRKKVLPEWLPFIHGQNNIVDVSTNGNLIWKNMTSLKPHTMWKIIFINNPHSLKKLTLILDEGWEEFSEFDVSLLSPMNGLEYLKISPYKELRLDVEHDSELDNSYKYKILLKNLMSLPQSLKILVLHWQITYGNELQSWNWLERLQNLQELELLGNRPYYDYRAAAFRDEFPDDEHSDFEEFEKDFPPWYVSRDTTPEIIGTQTAMTLDIISLLQSLPSNCKKLTLVAIDFLAKLADYLFTEDVDYLEEELDDFIVQKFKLYVLDGIFGRFEEHLATKMIFIKKL